LGDVRFLGVVRIAGRWNFDRDGSSSCAVTIRARRRADLGCDVSAASRVPRLAPSGLPDGHSVAAWRQTSCHTPGTPRSS
jgi:hypothetical protein